VLRFLHTADWQLGMTRRYLGAEAQARFAQARLDAVVRLGEVARARACAFVVVAGDAFDSNLVDRPTLRRALEALARVPVPVLLLPGNHDAFDAASVYRSAAFLEGRPSHVHVLAGAGAVYRGLDGVEVVGVPWLSRKPAHDLVAAALGSLPPPAGLRVLVAHGRTDAFRPARREAASIGMRTVERAFERRLLHYLALGDRHSFSPAGASGRAFYAGPPEPTDFDEERPGHVLVVELEPGAESKPRVDPVGVATWRFLRLAVEVGAAADVDELLRTLAAMTDKERTVLRLELSGSLDAAAWSALEHGLDASRETFAAVDRVDRGLLLATDAFATPEGLAGWPAQAAMSLAARAPHEAAARDALLLLHRLAQATEAR